MNRFLFVAAIGFLSAATASAEPPVAPAPVVTGVAPAPIVSSTVPAPVVVNTLTAPPAHRMGLFGRIRARNTNPMLTTSAAYTPGPVLVTPNTTVPAAMPSTAPMPMPGKTSSATPGVTGTPVVVAGAMVPEEMAPTPMPVMMAPMGTMPMTEVVPMTTPHRMGLFARLRARRM